MSPITNWLEHHGVGRGLGSLIALIVVVAVLVASSASYRLFCSVKSWKS